MTTESKFKVGQLVNVDSYGEVVVHSMEWNPLYARWAYYIRYQDKQTREMYPVFEHRMRLSYDLDTANRIIADQIDKQITEVEDVLVSLKETLALFRTA